MHITVYLTVFLLGVACGYYLHYKFGARVAADLQQIKQMKP